MEKLDICDCDTYEVVLRAGFCCLVECVREVVFSIV